MTQLIAESNDLRILVLKGEPLSAYGLRPAKVSADVDLLVRPADMSTLQGELEAKGWQIRPQESNPAFPQHSVTYFHPEWPCDVDLHYSYPGIEAPTETTFNLLWENRKAYVFAGISCWVPDYNASLVFLALHALRTPWEQKSQSVLHYLSTEVAPPPREELMELVTQIDAVAALGPFLLKVYGAEVLVGRDMLPSRSWMQRLKADRPGAARWAALREAPWPEKFLILANSIYPTREQLAATDLTLLHASELCLARRRLKRLAKFISGRWD